MPNPIYLIAGARPNFMKIAPLIKKLEVNDLPYKLIHTGQHYDYNMSKIFFDDLGIPEPDIHLNVGSASHAVQTAQIMIKFEKVILTERPSLIVVVGDVNSTLACALVAKKLHISVAHVEAGLRSYDRRMPEEINRVLTDQLSELLFTSEPSGRRNLLKEGISETKIHFVGNIMIDTLVSNLEKSKNLKTYDQYGLEKGSYALITLHRPSNVDDKKSLEKLIGIINYIQSKTKVFFPMHPRTRNRVSQFGLDDILVGKNMIITEPIGYLEFLDLMAHARFILTDSGGIQEEASYLKVPVLTLRENTERPVTIEKGTNTIVGKDFNKITELVDSILAGTYKIGSEIEKWDGNTAERIVHILSVKLS
ncbi:MAG: UDP-N-acetylglucosamine 2-epimerase (non-hydrolyzing) [Candidatus Lokiarchaeota archaeon]|nr:UDP-N-acetylglucosamine 2-epimerase (non-hydrolyzing) [Candidatus Lokiarchaeota archaeon]